MLLAAFGLLSGCGPARPVSARGKPVSYWVRAIQDPDGQLRRRAARTLGNVGAADPAVFPALIQAVKDPEVAVRSEAILALLKIGPAAREAVPTLREAEKDTDGRVRSHAATALKKIQAAK